MTLVLALLAAVAQDSWPVVVDGKPFTTLYAGTAKPYLHPLRSASGKILTRQYPMADVAGETKDHPHHRGLWFSHGDVNGWDFWANEESQKGVGKGKGVIKLRDAKQHNGSLLAFSADWLDGDGNLVLTEDRIMRFQAGADTRAIDFEINRVARTAVTFGDTKEGTFAIRLNDQMIEGKGGNGKMTAADDRVGEKLIWGKRSPWVDYAGTVDGEPVAIAIFDHPSNPHAPTYWHARAYGLFAANIFGLHDFYNDKSKDGSVKLKTGDKLLFRYRVWIHPGPTDPGKVGAAYQQWAGR